jgi:hypothetical protein
MTASIWIADRGRRVLVARAEGALPRFGTSATSASGWPCEFVDGSCRTGETRSVITGLGSSISSLLFAAT